MLIGKYIYQQLNNCFIFLTTLILNEHTTKSLQPPHKHTGGAREFTNDHLKKNSSFYCFRPIKWPRMMLIVSCSTTRMMKSLKEPKRLQPQQARRSWRVPMFPSTALGSEIFCLNQSYFGQSLTVVLNIHLKVRVICLLGLLPSLQTVV